MEVARSLEICQAHRTFEVTVNYRAGKVDFKIQVATESDNLNKHFSKK